VLFVAVTCWQRGAVRDDQGGNAHLTRVARRVSARTARTGRAAAIVVPAIPGAVSMRGRTARHLPDVVMLEQRQPGLLRSERLVACEKMGGCWSTSASVGWHELCCIGPCEGPAWALETSTASQRECEIRASGCACTIERVACVGVSVGTLSYRAPDSG
jgi:hypothetical protein